MELITQEKDFIKPDTAQDIKNLSITMERLSALIQDHGFIKKELLLERIKELEAENKDLKSVVRFYKSE